MADNAQYLAFLLRIADDHLILGHRVSEWCGHAPMLEEDLALPNIALDLIGQARALYDHAAAIEGKGRSEDDLAYLRHERAYTNCLLVERENGDFAHTVLRQLLFSAFMEPYWASIINSSDEKLAAIAGKAVKEAAYHIRHCGEWVIRLGDGTEESARRMSDAAVALAPYAGELFEDDDVTAAMAAAAIAPQPSTIRDAWQHTIDGVLGEAGIEIPADVYAQTGGRTGRHGEEMGHLLAELQFVQRAHPGAQW